MAQEEILEQTEEIQNTEDNNVSDLQELMEDPQFPMVLQELRTIVEGFNLPNLKAAFLFMFMLVDTLASSDDLAQLVQIQAKNVDGIITPEEISNLANSYSQPETEGEQVEGEENSTQQLPSSTALVEGKVIEGINSAKEGLIPPEEAQETSLEEKTPEDNITIRTISVGDDEDSSKVETLSDKIKRKKKLMGL